MKSKLLLLLLFILPISVFAYDIEQDGICYNFIDDKYEVAVSGSSKSELVIPNRIFFEGKEYVVTSINRGAFYDRRDLLSVVICDSIRDIMDMAFYNCSGLEKLKFGKNVAELGKDAFGCCEKLDSVCIPDSVVKIGNGAFANCYKLKYVKMGKKTRMLDDYAFSQCYSLEHIVFQKLLEPNPGLTVCSLYFSASAFSNCTKMRRVDVEDLSQWSNSSANGWPASPLTYGPDLYLNGELVTKLIIPNDVHEIGRFAFQICPSIQYVELPENNIYVDDYAFRYSNVQVLRIKGGEDTYLRGYSFDGCDKLMKVIAESKIPANIEETTFCTDTYYKGTLYVPVGSKQVYKSKKGWDKFVNIKEGIPAVDVETFSFTINAGEGGTVVYDNYTINNGKQTVELQKGSSAKISFLPYSEYVLDKVLLNGRDITSEIVDNQYEINDVSSSLVLDVTFKINQYYLTICQTNAATIKQEVKSHKRYEILVLPSEGYKITNVMYNGNDVTYEVANSGLYTTPAITQNSELVITQEPLHRKVSCFISEGGSVSFAGHENVDGCEEYLLDNGANLGIECNASDGYELKCLYIDGIPVECGTEGTFYNYGLLNKDVSIQAFFQKKEKKLYNLEIQDADFGVSFMKALEGQTVRYTINETADWKLNTISFNGIDMTENVEGNTYVTPKITGNSLLCITFEKEVSGIRQNEIKKIKVYPEGKNVKVENIDVGQMIHIYGVDGNIISQIKATQEKMCIPLPSSGIYIISVGTKTVKLIM